LPTLDCALVGGDFKSPTHELRISNPQQLQQQDEHTQQIVTSYLHLALEYIARFYARQLSTSTQKTADLLLRFENLLSRYYDEGVYKRQGLPTVKYCAEQLFLSPSSTIVACKARTISATSSAN